MIVAVALQIGGEQFDGDVAVVLPPVRNAGGFHRTSPARCTIGTAQLLAYSTISPVGCR